MRTYVVTLGRKFYEHVVHEGRELHVSAEAPVQVQVECTEAALEVLEKDALALTRTQEGVPDDLKMAARFSLTRMRMARNSG